MELFSVIRLFSHVTVLATIIASVLINVSPTHAAKNVKISQSEADDVASANNERHLSTFGDSPPGSDSYSYERGYLVVVNEDDFVLVGANGGDLFPASEYGGAAVACDDSYAFSTCSAASLPTFCQATDASIDCNTLLTKVNECISLSDPSRPDEYVVYDPNNCGDGTTAPIAGCGNNGGDGFCRVCGLGNEPTILPCATGFYSPFYEPLNGQPKAEANQRVGPQNINDVLGLPVQCDVAFEGEISGVPAGALTSKKVGSLSGKRKAAGPLCANEELLGWLDGQSLRTPSKLDGSSVFQSAMGWLDGPSPRTPSSLDGSSVFQSGLVYDPTELKIRNKPDGVTEEEIWNTSWVQQHTCNAPMVMDSALGRQFAGGRQPVQPLPPGDKSYFFHSECVATSVIEDRKGTSSYNYGDTSLVTSHSCTLNLCLGGGGFDCIAIFAGGGYVFDLSPNGPDGGPIELAPPFRGTILGGTGSFEGIEGTVDVVTITGSTGPIPLVESPSYDSYMYRTWNVGKRICILAKDRGLRGLVSK